MIRIRYEQPADIGRVRKINTKAFAQEAEADIVDRLRNSCPDSLYLVAEEDGEVVGHIAFTPVTVKAQHGTVCGMGLAPMAVEPTRQRQGIGSLLVEAGLAMLKDRGCPFVIVLGHPEYYPRFSFERASKYGITCQWEGVPDEAFMISVLDKEALREGSGTAYYREEFDAAM